MRAAREAVKVVESRGRLHQETLIRIAVVTGACVIAERLAQDDVVVKNYMLRTK